MVASPVKGVKLRESPLKSAAKSQRDHRTNEGTEHTPQSVQIQKEMQLRRYYLVNIENAGVAEAGKSTAEVD